MIRPERYQYNFKPKWKNEEDIFLVNELEELRKEMKLKKSEFVRLALHKLLKSNKKGRK